MSSPASDFQPVVQTLVTYLNNHLDFKADFEYALKEAKSKGIKEFDLIKNLDDYIQSYNDLLNWVPVEDASATVILYKLCMFYFVIDLLPSKYQTPIEPGGGWTWLSQWLVDYAQALGGWMDDPRSITEESVKTFYLSKEPAPKGYHMQDYPVPPGGWNTFNEFFARHIDPNVRPICAPHDSTVIVNPADCTFKEAQPISSNDTTQFVSPKGVPWSISELLQDTVFGEKFKGGQFMHAFLSTTDYHRQHAPVCGRVVEAKVIPGICYLEVIAVPGGDGNRLEMHRDLRCVQRGMRDQTQQGGVQTMDAPDNPGYQFLQARGLIVIENDVLGLVAVMPIGMAQVSSVVISDNVKVGSFLNKGDEICKFQLGGSDIIMVFEKKANVDFSKTEQKWRPYGSLLVTANPEKD